MITGRQMRAARGLLEWSAEELARKAGVTRLTINNIESDSVQPQEKTLANILTAFDKSGIEFLENEGVCIRKQQVRVFAGKAGYRQFLDHVYEVLKDEGGRVRQFNLSDANNLSFADDYGQAHLIRMGTIENLDARVLTMEGDTTFQAPYCQYRWLSKDDKALAPFYVYGDYLAMPMYESANKRELLVIRSKLLAERYCEQFDKFWGSAVVPKVVPSKKVKRTF